MASEPIQQQYKRSTAHISPTCILLNIVSNSNVVLCNVQISNSKVCSLLLGLRPPKKKPGKPPPMTNAERCKKYRAGVAADKSRNEIAKQKKKEANQKYWSSLTEEQKVEHKERSKLRQQKRR